MSEQCMQAQNVDDNQYCQFRRRWNIAWKNDWLNSVQSEPAQSINQILFNVA